MNIGKKAPDFSLPGSEGETVRLSDFLGKKVILYFYPKDMTPGCTTEACDFRDRHQDFSDLNAVIVGISPDPVSRHGKFKEKHGLPFLLLGIERSTFVIDEEGTLVKEWRKVKVQGHADEALAFLREAGQ